MTANYTRLLLCAAVLCLAAMTTVAATAHVAAPHHFQEYPDANGDYWAPDFDRGYDDDEPYPEEDADIEGDVSDDLDGLTEDEQKEVVEGFIQYLLGLGSGAAGKLLGAIGELYEEYVSEENRSKASSMYNDAHEYMSDRRKDIGSRFGKAKQFAGTARDNVFAAPRNAYSAATSRFDTLRTGASNKFDEFSAMGTNGLNTARGYRDAAYKLPGNAWEHAFGAVPEEGQEELTRFGRVKKRLSGMKDSVLGAPGRFKKAAGKRMNELYEKYVPESVRNYWGPPKAAEQEAEQEAAPVPAEQPMEFGPVDRTWDRMPHETTNAAKMQKNRRKKMMRANKPAYKQHPAHQQARYAPKNSKASRIPNQKYQGGKHNRQPHYAKNRNKGFKGGRRN